MKKIAIALLLASSFANSKEIIGIGEYRFGPDMPKNVACQMAEDKAKQDAIARFSGEAIEFVSNETCKNEKCEIQRESITQIRGYIHSIYRRSEQTVEALGYTACYVLIGANVYPTVNEINLTLNDFYMFKHGQELVINGVSNRKGNLAVYHFYDGVYYRLYTHKIATPGSQFVLPSVNGDRVYMRLKEGQQSSKELITFLFSESNVNFKKKFTEMEFKNFMENIPSEGRKVINRYVFTVR
jgi:hypothetical protein